MYYKINDDFSAAYIRVPGSIPPESPMGNPKNPAENSERPTENGERRKLPSFCP
jgi:hypothetical protein